MKQLEAKKDSFIRRELWLLTYSAAFQRVNIYTKLDKVSEKVRQDFKEEMFTWCNQLVENQYHQEVSEDQHINNINSLIGYTSEHFSHILDNQKLKFGVGQKILNLYLKYLWCVGDIPVPPHFPVDRIIQDLLRLPEKYSWTKMASVDQYKAIIKQAKQIQKAKDYSSLAEMELYIYKR